MADFGTFKLTNVGKALQYKIQSGKQLKFSHFALGDGSYSGNIEDLTSLVNPIRNENITRLNYNASESGKTIIGFDLDSKNITTGFYLREIGLYALDPDTQQSVLMFYGNSSDTADYIPSNTETTISTKTIDLEVYISNATSITAIIDSSLVYATQRELESMQEYIDIHLDEKADTTQIPTKVSQLTNDSGYLKSFTEKDPTVPSWAKASSKPTYSFSEIQSRPTITTQTTITNFWFGTEAQYNSISNKSATTLYLIKEE